MRSAPTWIQVSPAGERTRGFFALGRSREGVYGCGMAYGGSV
jgi:hypothetical protein